MTNYERAVSELLKHPEQQEGKVAVPVSRVDDPHAVIQRQNDLPKEMLIDFNRTRIEKDAIIVYPPDYDPQKKYDLLLVLHGKGSHPARLSDFPEMTGIDDAIMVIPKAPFQFGTGYSWFAEGTDQEQSMKSSSITLINNVIDRYQKEQRITDHVFIAGISEGGHMAYLAGMRLPGKIKGIIAINAPFREDYFDPSDLRAVTPANHPGVCILQNTNDRIVPPANAQRAYAFYKSKGLSLRNLSMYQKGDHHELSGAMGRDIREWINGNGKKSYSAAAQESSVLLPQYEETLARIKSVERLVPVIIKLASAIPNENQRERVTNRLRVCVSAISYCRFQLELKIKDISTKTDPALLETSSWLYQEAVALLQQSESLTYQDKPGSALEIGIEVILKSL
jgi:predicted esterase